MTFSVAVESAVVDTAGLTEVIEYEPRFKPPVFVGGVHVKVICPGAATALIAVALSGTD